MWAVLAFLLNYVPNIGVVISAVPPMIQVLLFNGIYECILVGALFLVVHMVIGNILEPRMMGHRLGMSTMVVFLSLLIWGWLLGPGRDATLLVPLTSVCGIWMENHQRRQQTGDFTGQADRKVGYRDEASGVTIRTFIFH